MNLQKSVVFLYTCSEQLEVKFRKQTLDKSSKTYVGSVYWKLQNSDERN